MNKKIALATFATLAFPVAVTFAQATPTTTMENSTLNKGQERRAQVTQAKNELAQQKNELRQTRETFRNTKEKMNEQRCKNIETRVDTRLKRYRNNEQMLQNVFGKMKTRLDRLVVKLKAAGADTTTLEADLVTLQAKIDKLNTDQASFMATISETQTFACGKSEGEFAEKLGEARKISPLIKQDRQDIRNFFQTKIRPDLQAIRKTLSDEEEIISEKTEVPETSETPSTTPLSAN